MKKLANLLLLGSVVFAALGVWASDGGDATTVVSDSVAARTKQWKKKMDNVNAANAPKTKEQLTGKPDENALLKKCTKSCEKQVSAYFLPKLREMCGTNPDLILAARKMYALKAALKKYDVGSEQYNAEVKKIKEMNSSCEGADLNVLAQIDMFNNSPKLRAASYDAADWEEASQTHAKTKGRSLFKKEIDDKNVSSGKNKVHEQIRGKKKTNETVVEGEEKNRAESEQDKDEDYLEDMKKKAEAVSALVKKIGGDYLNQNIYGDGEKSSPFERGMKCIAQCRDEDGTKSGRHLTTKDVDKKEKEANDNEEKFVRPQPEDTDESAYAESSDTTPDATAGGDGDNSANPTTAENNQTGGGDSED